MNIWTRTYWKATVERMIRGGAAATISTFVVGDQVMNAFTIDWSEAGGLFLGGAAASMLFSLIGNAATGEGPAITHAETLE